MNDLMKYISSDDILDDVCQIVENAQTMAYRSVNVVLVIRNWLLGRRISEEELKGSERATYGEKIIDKISESLTNTYGKGFTRRSLYKFQQFYKYFPEIVPSVTAQLLSWTHYEKLLQVTDNNARNWYANECLNQSWSVRTLQRNISSQYYYRILKSQDPSRIEAEMKEMYYGFAKAA